MIKRLNIRSAINPGRRVLNLSPCTFGKVRVYPIELKFSFASPWLTLGDIDGCIYVMIDGLLCGNEDEVEGFDGTVFRRMYVGRSGKLPRPVYLSDDEFNIH